MQKWDKRDTVNILEALRIYSASSNENIPQATIEVWVQQFSELGLSTKQVLNVIKKASYKKKFGSTAFSDFTEILQEENQLYTHEEMITRAREMANVIYQNEKSAAEFRQRYEQEANNEVEKSKQELEKFISDLEYRRQVIHALTNETLDRISAIVKEFLIRNKYPEIVEKVEKLILTEKFLELKVKL